MSRPNCHDCQTPMLRSTSGWVCPSCPAKLVLAEKDTRVELGQPPAGKECDECDGTGKVECEDCNGSGEEECPHCGSWTDCEECEGRGWLYCECEAGEALEEADARKQADKLAAVAAMKSALA